jgi:DNA helicase-2/ATP-dependent DNA helicase PcrA
MQGIIEKVNLCYDPKVINLLTNHRFKNNSKILLFDENIRKIAKNPVNPNIINNAYLNVARSSNQNEEAKQIVAKVQKLVEIDPKCTIAILTRSGRVNQNTIKLVEYFNSQKKEGFSYFFALYSDEDQEYIEFHRKCLNSLYINRNKYHNFLGVRKKIIQELLMENPSETWSSLLILLDAFFTQIAEEYRFLSIEEKLDLVIDTFHNNALKQYLMYVKTSQVTLSTIHGSKGLEWDYVILPDMERFSFPSFPGLCKSCVPVDDCNPDWNEVFSNDRSDFFRLFKEELNVFYVGGTRARKEVYFTYSDEGFNVSGGKRNNLPSCFLNLNGFHIVTE